MDADIHLFTHLFKKNSLGICYDAETKADTEEAPWMLNEQINEWWMDKWMATVSAPLLVKLGTGGQKTGVSENEASSEQEVNVL